MKNLNRVTLIGNLGSDPEIKYTQSGTPVANFSLATNESCKDKQNEWQTKTEWHRCVAWAKLAEICSQYLSKGSQVFVEGKLRTRTWNDKGGTKHYTTEVHISNLIMLGGKRESTESTEQDDFPTEPSFNAGPTSEEDVPF